MLEIIPMFTLLLAVLLSVALVTLVERKVLATVQGRVGPNIVGYMGIGQPFADAAKLIFKETIATFASQSFLFFLSPIMIFSLSLISWGVINFSEKDFLYDFPINGLVIALITSLMAQYILFSGWSSGSKYALLGALRAAAQFISYEMFLTLAILNISISNQTLNFNEIIFNQEAKGINITLFFCGAVFFFIGALAENNRPPFDLPEAEGELVAGYHVEYTSLPFAFFYISEYANFLFNAVLVSIFFLSVTSFNFMLTDLMWVIVPTLFLIQICIRASFPRYMVENIMEIGWKYGLPLNLVVILYTLCMTFFSSL